ncbi:MAG: hypothetical protein A2Y71_07190 [Bacteroidetes bacterium RBG_13_42_15]|nr:MAG: hypothetical protein A2Y71_07190 [Bacteroidetes bacterium RBG_13_42_15]
MWKSKTRLLRGRWKIVNIPSFCANGSLISIYKSVSNQGRVQKIQGSPFEIDTADLDIFSSVTF